MTFGIIKLIIKKYYVYRKSLHSPFNTKLKHRFKTLRNQVSKQIREAKTRYFQTSAASKCWRVINEHLGKKRKIVSSGPNQLCYNGSVFTSDQDIANCFNKYFTPV